MNSALKQPPAAQGASQLDEEVVTTLYLCSGADEALEIWSPETRDFIAEHLPKLKIVELNLGENVSDQVAHPGFGILLCETNTKSKTERGLKLVRNVLDKIRQKDVTVSFITDSASEAIEQLEKSHVIQVLSPATSSKALKIKLEFLFSKMKAAKNALQASEEEDYLFKAAQEKKQSEKVIHLKKEVKKTNSGLHSQEDPPLEAKTVESPEKSEPEIVEELFLTEFTPDPNKLPSASDISGLGLPGMKRIVLISPRNDDLAFTAEISRRTGASFHYFHEANENLQNFLTRFPETVVFWDIDHVEATDYRSHHSAENIGLTLTRLIPPMQIFALSNENINRLPYIFNYQKHVFSHCLFRGGNPSAVGVYSKIVGKMMSQDPFDIQGYFGEDAKSQQITITQNAHRAAAVKATERFLAKCGLIPRLSVQASQAADELILNAIHSAPVDSSGNHYRKDLEQPPNFRFSNREHITLSVFQNDSFYAISVRDHFGSLKADEVLHHLQKNYTQESTAAGSGLGLNSVLGSGFSLLIAVKPGKLSEVSIFFPNAKSYRSFRRTFRFLSVTSVEEGDEG